MGHKERKKKNEKAEDATAEKDKADDEESQYSYITEDEDKEPAAEPPARPVGRTVTMTASKAKARPRSQSSSSDRGPRARELRSPLPPPREEGRTWKAAAVKAERPSSPTRTTRGRSVAPVMPPPHTVPASDPPRRRKSGEEDPPDAHGAKPERDTERDAAGAAEDKLHNDPYEGTGKGHGKGNPYGGHHGDYDDEDAHHDPYEGSKGWQKDEPARWRRWSVQCPYCKHYVAETRGSSGLSQHMWWSEHCLQHQLWYKGGYSWREAGRRAAIVKAQRETEAAHEKGPRAPETAVLPARSGAHRMALEEERHPKEKDNKEKKEKKRRRRHRHVSASVDAVERTRRRKPPSDSGDEGDRKATGREEVWIKVPRASLLAR